MPITDDIAPASVGDVDVITRVELRRYDWPVAAGGAARASITRSAIVVAGYDADGRVAFGEAAPLPGMSRETIDEAHAQLARFAVDPTRVEARAPSVQFAIETVQLGLVARREAIALHAVLARAVVPDAVAAPPPAIPCAVVVDTPSEAARYPAGTTLKIKIGKHCDEDRVLAIRRAAPTARLRLDANRTWTPDRARTELAALAHLPIEFVEEPCVTPCFDLPIPVALDESLAGMDDAAIDRALAEPELAALVLKPSLLGLRRALALARRAHVAGKPAIVTHMLEGPVGTAACCELALAIPHGSSPLGHRPPAGLAPHGALSAWATRVPQLVITGTPLVVAGAWPGIGIDAWPTLDGQR